MILRLFVLVLISLWFPGAYKRWTHAFRLQKCAVSWPAEAAWECSDPDPSIQKILEAPFTYYSKGAQSYVFLSSDQKHVLKLFRFDACKVPLGQIWVRKVRKWVHLSEKHDMPLDLKVKKTFTSCSLSYRLIPHLTGVLWVHLNPKEMALPPILVKDRLGRTHQVDPAKYRFALQKRADPFLPTLLHAADPLAFIDSYRSLLQDLSERGIANLDPTMGKNFGFIEGRAVEIDFGNFALDPLRAAGDPAHFSNRLDQWVKKHRPEIAIQMEKREALP